MLKSCTIIQYVYIFFLGLDMYQPIYIGVSPDDLVGLVGSVVNT
ncbi:hypothetical protein EMIT040CA3_340014 [Bacillus pseudomycoides]